MYGTKQAGNLWGTHIQETHTKEGAARKVGDRCLYTLKVGNSIVHIEVHVEDILVTGKDLWAVIRTKAMISRPLNVRDLGVMKDFLGMEVKWNLANNSVSLANPRHTGELLDAFGMSDCKPNVTPMVRGTELGAGEPLEEENRFAELVGSLLYLCNQTRPELAFAVGRLARRMANPTQGDMTEAKNVLRYLKGTRRMGILYRGAKGLASWVDADFARDIDTRKYITVFIFMTHGGAVSWRSRLQRLVTPSSEGVFR